MIRITFINLHVRPKAKDQKTLLLLKVGIVFLRATISNFCGVFLFCVIFHVSPTEDPRFQFHKTNPVCFCSKIPNSLIVLFFGEAQCLESIPQVQPTRLTWRETPQSVGPTSAC